jgi:hypothetical protein
MLQEIAKAVTQQISVVARAEVRIKFEIVQA